MVIELCVVQFWSEIILMISNQTDAARSFDFEITRMISDQIALHSVQLPLWITSGAWTIFFFLGVYLHIFLSILGSQRCWKLSLLKDRRLTHHAVKYDPSMSWKQLLVINEDCYLMVHMVWWSLPRQPAFTWQILRKSNGCSGLS